MPSKPLNILLINSNRFHDPGPILPIGLCLVAAALRADGHKIRVLDLCFSMDTQGDIQSAVAEFSPQLVGISIRNIDTCNGFQPRFLIDETLRDVIVPLKSLYAGPIVVGGAAAGINGQALLEHVGLDYAAHGDGEATMVEVARRLAAGRSLVDCPGLVVRDGAGYKKNPANLIENLDTLPFSSVHDFLDLAEYRSYGTPLGIQSKRGCALSCSYCTYNNIEGTTYRLRTPELIAQEISEFVAATDYRRVEFVDSTFNVPLDHAKAVLRAISSLNLNLNLSTMGLNPRFIDQELISLMKQAGFTEISLGVESGNDITLKGLGKNFRVVDIEAAGRITRAAKIATMWYLLLGGPGETAETVRDTIRTIAKVAGRWDIVNIGVGLRAYEGSPIARQMADQDPLQGEAGFFRPVAYVSDGISIPEIKRIASQACVLHHNFLMFDDGANIDPQFSKSFTKSFPRQPIWRAYVVSRFIGKFTGVWLIKAALSVIFAPLIRRGLQKKHWNAMALDQAP